MTSPRRSKITPEREHEFYEAVLDLLMEGGYDALTMEGIAARTRSGKSTLYRQWQTKSRLVAAALRSSICARLALIDTGTLAGDLMEAARITAAGAGRDTPLINAVCHAAQRNADLLCAVREALIEPEVTAIDQMICRAVRRGEIDPDNPAAEFVAAQMIGVLRSRPILDGPNVDEDYLTRFLESSVFPALGLRTAGSPLATASS